MTEEPDARDPVAAAEELTVTLRDLTAQFARLQRSEKWWRRVIIGLAVSFLLDLGVTAGLGWNTIRQDDIQAEQAATQAESHANLIKACRLANADRTRDVAFFRSILTLPPGATARQRAIVAADMAKVRAKDKLRDCAALYATSP